jgi:hypothetical protein
MLIKSEPMVAIAVVLPAHGPPVNKNLVKAKSSIFAFVLGSSVLL